MTTTDGVLGRKQRITSLLRTHAGEMIAAVAGKGLFRVEGDNVVALPEDPIKGELVRALFEDSHGRLWIGHEHGVACRDQGKFARLPAAGSSVLTRVRGIAEDRDGTMWFVGKEGLARESGGHLELVRVPALPNQSNLLGLFVDRSGAIWIGVESKGILRWQDEQAFLFTARHGLPIASPGAFLEEGEYLWVSGEKGLVRISRASLEAVAAKRTGRLELQLFNRADGLPSDACRRGYQPTAFKSSDGQLWFATHKGAISVHPQDITTATYEPPATIEEIRAESQQILVTPANRDHIEIPAGTRHMTIRCSVPSLGRPEYARFQYMLEGFDNVWRDAGNERVIRFYDLPPGSYRFLVRAIGTDGRFVETTVVGHAVCASLPLAAAVVSRTGPFGFGRGGGLRGLAQPATAHPAPGGKAPRAGGAGRAGVAAPASAENGRAGAARRGHRPRFQQPPHERRRQCRTASE